MNNNNSLMHEITTVTQIPGEAPRRWFYATSMDLFVWMGESGCYAWLLSFQEEGDSGYSVSWREEAGLRCNRLDSGEDSV